MRELRRAWKPRTEVVATPRPGTAELREQLLERYLTVADWSGFDGRLGDVLAAGASYVVIGRRLFAATAPSSKEVPE